MTLEPLDPFASEELVAELLRRADAVPAVLRDMLVGRSEGNPFIAEELVRMLLEDGIIEHAPHEPETWHVRADRLGEVRIPSGLIGVLQARLDRLEPVERAMLQRASVIGRRFWDRTITHLATVDDPDSDRFLASPTAVDTAATLASLEGRELAFERTPSAFADCREYVFKHALVRDVAYGSLLRRQRRAYHGAAADWLLATGGDRTDEIAGVVGRHLEAAGRDGEAAIQYTRAAFRAAGAYANEEAIDLYRRALRLTGDHPAEASERELRGHVAEGLGDMLQLMARHEEARDGYRVALVAAPQGDAVAAARLHRLTAGAWAGEARFDEADAEFDAAETALGQIPETQDTGPARSDEARGETLPRTEPELRRWREWMAIQNDRMHARYFAFRDDELDALVERMRPIVERWGSPGERAGFYGGLVMAELRRYRYVIPAEVVDHARLHLEASREVGSPDRLAWSWLMIGFASLWHGDLAAAEAHIGTSLELAERTGDLTAEARCVTYLAVAARLRNDTRRVSSLVDRCLDTATRAGMPEYLATAHGNQA